jgi:diguanylate cyclase (GGDEF)-like protein
MVGFLRKFSLKRKIIAIMLLTSGIVLLLASVALVFREGVSFRKEGQEKLAVLADVIGSNASAPILFDDRQAATATLAGLGSNPHILAAYILAENGKVFAEYHTKNDRGDRAQGLTATPESMNIQTGFPSSSLWGSDLVVAKPISSEGKTIGKIVIQSDTMELASRLTWFLSVFSLIALVVLIIAYYISTKLQGIISEPIMELAGAMKMISVDKNYSIRATKEYDDEIGILIDGFNEMLSQIQERDEKLAYLAHFDGLTLLPNRIMFQDRLTQALSLAERTQQQIAILFIDLDEFKDVNDTLGHRFGDLLLKEVAERLHSHVRNSDTVARLGGDEFVIFLQNSGDVENVIDIAEKIMGAFADYFTLEGREFYVTASIGISLFPADGETVEELIKNSDAAMYHAKKQGKSRYQFFSPQMYEGTLKRLTIYLFFPRTRTPRPCSRAF